MPRFVVALIAYCLVTSSASASDAPGCADHPAMSRYPDSILEWCKTDNYLPFRVPVGPVTGYRAIGEWIDIEGRVTRNFYSLKNERTHPEVFKNYADAMREGGFEILAEGLFRERNVKGGVGGGSWLGVYYTENPWEGHGAVSKLVSGTSSSGGTGVVIGMKERAADTIYVVVSLEQHSSEEVATLITTVETKPAESGRVSADADAMGQDLLERGRTILHGLFFEHDKASLKAESNPALAEIAKVLASKTGDFYVVGHTDATGTYAYNLKLSADRAQAVREALIEGHGIAAKRLVAVGVGPVSPVFTNKDAAGREKNRRVELVER